MATITRAIAFCAAAVALVSCDGNINSDSETTASTLRISVGPEGAPPAFPSAFASITADGRYVAFLSIAQLTPNDPDNLPDLYIRDTVSQTTTLISILNNGTKFNNEANEPQITPDGHYVVFSSAATNIDPLDLDTNDDIYRKDLLTGNIVLVSRADGLGGAKADNRCRQARISANGQFVVFISQATNLDGMGAPYNDQVFVRDIVGGHTYIASVNTGGGQKANGFCEETAISADGSTVAFSTMANNFDPADPGPPNPSPDPYMDIYVVRNWDTSPVTTFISVNWDGNPKQMGGGGSVNPDSRHPSLSGDGSIVVFESLGKDLTTGVDKDFTDQGTDIFMRAWTVGSPVTKLISRNSAGVQAFEPGFSGSDGSNKDAYITPDGHYVAWSSVGQNLVAGDTNGKRDIFIRDMVTGEVTRVSVRTFGNEVNGDSDGPVLSDDGKYVAFFSSASNLVDDDNNGASDVFWRGPLH